MGLYIKGMKMPDGCYGCPVITWCRIYKNNEWGMPKKLDNCPLVEVSEPHGRLVDAEALHRAIDKKTGEPEYQHTGEDWVSGLFLADELVWEQLTVIEAEDE